MIIILGNSKTINDEVKKVFPHDEFLVLPWRKIDQIDINDINACKLVFVVGYDFATYASSFQTCFEANVLHPFNFLFHLRQKFDAPFIYFNTAPSRSETYSRYAFNKHKLAEKICLLQNSYIVFLSTLVKPNGWPTMRASFVEKLLMYFLIKLKIVKAITLSELQKHIMEYRESPTSCLPVKGILLKYRRSSLIDKALRFIVG